MIAFGTAISDAEAYRRYCQAGIRRHAEPDSAVHAFVNVGSVGRSMNVLLDAAAQHDDLEALVLIAQDVELADPEFCAKARAAVADPDVAVAGAVGSKGARTIAWWEGRVSSAPIVHRYQEYGGGDMSAFAWTSPQPPPMDVDVLDGFLLVLSPWAVRNLRFDEGLFLGFGFDFDFCMTALAAGKQLRTADLQVIRHAPLKLVEDLELWVEAHQVVAQKWEGALPGVEPTEGEDAWRMRARRAEAEREAARTLAYSNASKLEAHVQQLEGDLAEVTESRSWKVTTPLRWVNERRRQRALEKATP